VDDSAGLDWKRAKPTLDETERKLTSGFFRSSASSSFCGALQQHRLRGLLPNFIRLKRPGGNR